MELQTERLYLRPFQPEDAQDLYEYAKHPNVGPNAGWKPHASIEESQKILTMFMTGKDIIFAVVFKENKKVIGSLGLHTDTHRPQIPGCKMLGYVLSADYWGKGLMTEAAHAVIDFAFQDKSLRLLTCSHFPFNQRSKRVIEKCGFHFEGNLRYAYSLYNGEIIGDCCYSMTRTDYFVHKAKQLGYRLMLPEEQDCKAAFLDYLSEWTENDFFNPCAAALNGRCYEDWLSDSIRARTKAPENFVENTTYFLVNTQNQVVGVSNLRHALTPALLQSGGHIGYGVRPSARGQGLAKLLLALTLEKAQKKGISKALLTCNSDNTASYKTIEALGGRLQNTQQNDKSKPIHRYQIQLD